MKTNCEVPEPEARTVQIYDKWEVHAVVHGNSRQMTVIYWAIGGETIPGDPDDALRHICEILEKQACEEARLEEDNERFDRLRERENPCPPDQPTILNRRGY